MSRVGATVRRTFGSVRASRNFRLYFLGQVVSITGTWINATAGAVLVLRLSHSGVALGFNTALLFGPVLLLGAVGGVLADRFDKRRILVWTQSLYAVVALAMWVLVATDVVQLWMVYALSFAAGVVTAADNPARQSFYIELVGEERLTNAVSLNSAVFTGTRIVGAVIAGYVIHAAGLAVCYLIDCLSYLAVIVALSAMRPQEMHVQARSARVGGHLKEGFRYVRNTPELRRPLTLMAVVFTFAFNFMVLIPLLATRTFGGDARTLGWLSAFAGIWMFAGAMTMANRATRPTSARLSGFAALFGAALVVEALAPTLGLAYLLTVPLGVCAMLFAITANSTLQLTSRPEFRGRVMALYGMVFLGSTPVGAPIMGWIGESYGARAALVIGGLVATAVGLGALRIWSRGDRLARAAYQPGS